MSIIRKLSNLIVYSSLWIATCAAALVTFTYDITGSGIVLDAYVGFVFCGTFVIYSVHRLAGIERVKPFAELGRFAVISQFRSHILIYGALGILGALYFLIQLPLTLLWWLLLPGILSFMYVVPFGKKKRWRDYALVKIFLIAGVWAALTGLIPHIQTGQDTLGATLCIFAERALFIFSITIPFDIRDVLIDESELKTLPQVIGIRQAKLLALGTLLCAGILAMILIWSKVYDQKLVMPYLGCIVITAVLIWNSRTDHDDYYYSGLLDGTMFLLAFGYWVAT